MLLLRQQGRYLVVIDVLSKVNTRLGIAVKAICPNTGTVTADSSPAKFPFLSVNQMNNRSTAEDCENGENAVISDIELQAYSVKAVGEARNIIALANDEMRVMGYHRTAGGYEVKNVADTKVKRILARYRRTISSGDDL